MLLIPTGVAGAPFVSVSRSAAARPTRPVGPGPPADVTEEGHTEIMGDRWVMAGAGTTFGTGAKGHRSCTCRGFARVLVVTVLGLLRGVR
jgi:hypothetical protein